MTERTKTTAPRAKATVIRLAPKQSVERGRDAVVSLLGELLAGAMRGEYIGICISAERPDHTFKQWLSGSVFHDPIRATGAFYVAAVCADEYQKERA